MLKELFRTKTSDPDTPPDSPFSRSAIVFSYIGVVVALAISLTQNIYHDTHADAGGNIHYHPLPIGIAIMVGVGVPLLCGVLSHLAAEVDTGAVGKSVIYVIVGALMYVSARAGTAVMSPVLGGKTSVVLSVAVDAGAMFCIHVLMTDQKRKKALEKWNAGAAERQRQAAENRRAAEAEALAARGHGPRTPATRPGNGPLAPAGNAPGNTLSAAAGNTPGNGSGSTLGNTRGATAGGGLPGTARNVAGNGQEEAAGNVTPIGIRQATAPASGGKSSKTDEEWLLLIEAFYKHCVEAGGNFGTRAFIREHGGSSKRIGPLITRFLEERQSASEGRGEEGAG